MAVRLAGIADQECPGAMPAQTAVISGQLWCKLPGDVESQGQTGVRCALSDDLRLLGQRQAKMLVKGSNSKKIRGKGRETDRLEIGIFADSNRQTGKRNGQAG
ncbi:hypothetical protein PoB_003114100 [Plakobranchus ocellatus]|uniref:Uncharacterized protein n=1 Tax=Plakobranchus ocellatus TaxID=259542 RepID=A0AAV4ADA8_9GAST|nr:hypothetical protein PoB_003114100 [Plakobranchus ocellatus]